MFPYFVSYIGQTGYSGHVYGNAVCTSDEKIENVQQIRQMEAEIRKAEGCDRVVILNMVPLKE